MKEARFDRIALSRMIKSMPVVPLYADIHVTPYSILSKAAWFSKLSVEGESPPKKISSFSFPHRAGALSHHSAT